MHIGILRVGRWVCYFVYVAEHCIELFKHAFEPYLLVVI